MKERRKIAAVHSEFISEIDGLLRLDAQNQKRFRVGPGRPTIATFSKSQMHLITESIFTRAFSSYEGFLEDLFILYSRGKPTRAGTKVGSYLLPKNGQHARELIKSQMNFLEWNKPDTIIKRCEIYIEDGGPIKQAITTNVAALRNIKDVRNAIAHRSAEARMRYASVVRGELRAAPLRLPQPGEFLLTSDPGRPHPYFLISYLTVLKDVANVAAG
jgi:hypothetical protein